ncbi:MAG TPA: CHAT domain-containing protein [Candidatus Obscuribacterales bacterium]
MVAQLSADAREQDVLAELDEFVNLQNNLRDLGQNAVLIYPLILPDRLELVLITPYSEPTRYPIAVEQAELNGAILAFRQALTDPAQNPQPAAQRLYEWLIAPMAADLEAIGAETILYAPDGALRYVPLAALHDGDQWLVERFRVNHITAASLQDFTLRPDPQPRILAAAFSEGRYEIAQGDRRFTLGGLPFARVEVENLIAAFPGTTGLFNQDFSLAAVQPSLNQHTIVHLATHATFVTGSPRDSFILFGNGDRLTLEDLKGWRGRLNRVDLVVLSACETGVGGDTLGNGEEILGFGYLMQEAGASAAIASLWQVSDPGTESFMTGFYQALQAGQPKAEALRQAQIALINAQDAGAAGGDRAGAAPLSRDGTLANPGAYPGYSHPYYWAPFILIGNGL